MPVLCAYGYGIFLRYHSQRSLKEDEETTAMLAPLQTTSFLRTGTQLTFKGRPRQSEREGERVGDNCREKETERKRQREAETEKSRDREKQRNKECSSSPKIAEASQSPACRVLLPTARHVRAWDCFTGFSSGIGSDS